MVVGLRRGETEGRTVAPGDVALLLLALVTAVLVARTLRATPPPALAAASAPAPGVTSTIVGAPVSSAAPSPSSSRDGTGPDRGALAVSGTTLLRWSGNACAPGGSDTSVERSADGGATWRPYAVPLATVTSLSFSGATAIASGLAADDCAPAYADSRDGGLTWRALTPPASPVKAVGPPFKAAVDGCVTNAAGAASLVAVATENAAWLACQRADGRDRLLLRTRDAGKTWERLAGRRAETGLAGDGVVEQLGFAPGAGWALVRGGTRCAAGDLRTSADLGAHWTARPCAAVAKVLAVAFGDGARGVLLGVRDGAVVLLRTSDGGRSWSG